MGRNTGNGKRIGNVKERTQTYNPKTNQFVKRDTATGRIIGTKSTPFKSVRKDARAKAVQDTNKN